MSLDFLTSKFIINEHDFKTPIIVTGAGGCIGSWVLSILTKSKIPCVGFDPVSYTHLTLPTNC
mgnify:CR=1 FL=1